MTGVCILIGYDLFRLSGKFKASFCGMLRRKGKRAISIRRGFKQWGDARPGCGR